jgi:hypothetical protein
VDARSWIILITGVIASFVAVIGYLLNQFSIRNERRSRVYAEALLAVFEYEELPYRIRRRTAEEGSSAAIAQRINDVFERLSFYQAWMTLESPAVGSAYLDLVKKTQAEGGPHRGNAWSHPPASNDREFHFPHPVYNYHNKLERQLCMQAMRHEMRFWSFARRGKTKGIEIDDQTDK